MNKKFSIKKVKLFLIFSTLGYLGCLALFIGGSLIIKNENSFDLFNYFRVLHNGLYWTILIAIPICYTLIMIFASFLGAKKEFNILFLSICLLLAFCSFAIAIVETVKFIGILDYAISSELSISGAVIITSFLLFLNLFEMIDCLIVLIGVCTKKEITSNVNSNKTPNSEDAFNQYQNSTMNEQILNLKLGKLNSMLRNGLIDEQEYKQLRKKLIDNSEI